MSERPGILFRFEIMDALEQLDLADAGFLFVSAMRYGRYGETPTFQNPVLSVVWAFIKTAVDRDAEAYDVKIAQRRYAVYVRESKRKNETPLDFDEWKSSTDIGNERPMPPDIHVQDHYQSQTQTHFQNHHQTQGADASPCTCGGDDKRESEILRICSEAVGKIDAAERRMILTACAGMNVSNVQKAVNVAKGYGARSAKYLARTIQSQREKPERSPKTSNVLGEGLRRAPKIPDRGSDGKERICGTT